MIKRRSYSRTLAGAALLAAAAAPWVIACGSDAADLPATTPVPSATATATTMPTTTATTPPPPTPSCTDGDEERRRDRRRLRRRPAREVRRRSGLRGAGDCASGVCTGGVCSAAELHRRQRRTATRPTSTAAAVLPRVRRRQGLRGRRRLHERPVHSGGTAPSPTVQRHASRTAPRPTSTAAATRAPRAPTRQGLRARGRLREHDCAAHDEVRRARAATTRQERHRDRHRLRRQRAPRSARTGKACAVNADCVQRRLRQRRDEVRRRGCTDGVKNGGETDVDCGGPTCPKCATGKNCARGRATARAASAPRCKCVGSGSATTRSRTAPRPTSTAAAPAPRRAATARTAQRPPTARAASAPAGMCTAPACNDTREERHRDRRRLRRHLRHEVRKREELSRRRRLCERVLHQQRLHGARSGMDAVRYLLRALALLGGAAVHAVGLRSAVVRLLDGDGCRHSATTSAMWRCRSRSALPEGPVTAKVPFSNWRRERRLHDLPGGRGSDRPLQVTINYVDGTSVMLDTLNIPHELRAVCRARSA